MKILKKRKNKEFGTKPKRILYGKKIIKIKCQKKKREKKLTFNGKKNLNYPYLKPEKWRTKEKQDSLNKAGLEEENLDMVGERPRNQDQK